MNILLINGSPNKTGNTAALAAQLLQGKQYKTLQLTDYTIGSFGQNLPGDGLDAVIAAMQQAETIVIGSPVYWHNLCGSVRNVLDRFYGKVENGALSAASCTLSSRARRPNSECWRRANTPCSALPVSTA